MKSRSLVFLKGLPLPPLTLSALLLLWITNFIFWAGLSLNKSIIPLIFLLHKTSKSRDF